MITKDLLDGNASLKELTDEQKSAIVTLSANDEQSVMNTKFGQVHGDFDRMTDSVTGIAKEQGEKTSDYMRRVMSSLKEMNGILAGRIKDLEGEKFDLESKVSSGSADKELIAQKDASIADITAKYNKLQAEFKEAKDTFNRGILDYRINADVVAAMNGISFKEGINQETLAVLKNAAVSEVKAKHPSYVKTADGREVLVFHTEDGVEMRNEKDGLNLYTAQSLLKERLASFGILADEVKGGGAGGNGGTPKGGVPFAGAKSRAEARQMIEQSLFSNGMTRNSSGFDDAVRKVIDDNRSAYISLPTL